MINALCRSTSLKIAIVPGNRKEVWCRMRGMVDLPDLCCLPWVAMHRSASTVKTCCAQNEDYRTGESTSLKGDFNSPAIRAVRRAFLSGTVPNGCRECVLASKTTMTQKTV